MINLRKATEKDLESLLNLERSVNGVKTYSAMIDPEEFLAEMKKSEVFIIEKNEQIVGSIMFETKSPDHVYISGLVVAPDFQGQGIARRAMELVMEKIGNKNRIDLVTHPENDKAINLYKSLGFIIESQKENYFGDGEPRIVMAKIN